MAASYGGQASRLAIFVSCRREVSGTAYSALWTPAQIMPPLRDGSFEGTAVPRHFVPGYDRIVPPGHLATSSSQDSGRRKKLPTGLGHDNQPKSGTTGMNGEIRKKRPGGTADRSLARSAWDSVPPKIRPVRYWSDRTQLIQRISRRNVLNVQTPG